MNKIYKVVWSKVKHCYVVTSELAKRQTKGCGARSLRMATVSLGVAASLLCSGAVLPIFGESVAEASELTVTGCTGTNFTPTGSIIGSTSEYVYYPKDTGVTVLNLNGSWSFGLDIAGHYVNESGVNASGYTVNLNGPELFNNNSNCALYGARVRGGGNATANHVKISAGTVKGVVAGGCSTDGSANSNSVEIQGGTFSATSSAYSSLGIVGGVSSADASGNANNNTVEIKGGNIGTNVDGGLFDSFFASGNANGNTVTISGGTITGEVKGGAAGGTGIATGNNVNLNGGKVGNGYDAAYGGWAVKGNAENNHVNINGGTANGSVYGGQSKSSNSASADVIGNTITITKGTVTGYNNQWIYGGYTWGKQSGNNASGKAEDNTVTISGGTLSHDTSAADVSGGVSNGGDAIHNIVKIENTFTDKLSSVTGGEAGDANTKATKNEVTIAGGTVSGKVIGGQSGAGTAGGDTANDGNKVTISGGTVEGIVYGGYTDSGDAKYNTVTINESGQVNNTVYGGCSENGGKAIGNTVTLGDSAKVTNGVTAGRSGKSDAENNKVTVNNGTVSGYINGGVATGTAKENHIIVNNGTVSYLQGGSGTSATGNTIEVNNGTVSGYIYGGSANSGTSGGDTAKDGNKVTISGGTVEGTVYGGYTYSGDAKYNSVAVSGSGQVNNTVYGGYSNSGTATGNTVGISGGMVSGDVYGGYSESGNPTKNSVIISGGTFNGQGSDQLIGRQAIFGGYNHNGGSASDNTVTISGGTFIGSKGILIQGGRTYYEGGTTNNNTVNLTGTVTGLDKGSLLGGGSNASNTGNELHVGGTKDGTITGVWQGKTGDTVNNKVKSVANFDKVVLHSVKWDKDVAALEATTVKNVKTLDITNMQFDNPANGESMALLKSDSDLGASGVGIGLAYKDGSTEKTATSADLATGVTFDSGALADKAVNGVSLTGTQSKKVSLENSNHEIRYAFSSTVSGVTIATGTFTAGVAARKFGSGDNLTGATYTNNLAFSTDSKKNMESGQSMVILDATEAVAVSGATLPAFEKKTYAEAFSDAISGTVMTFAGKHTDTLALNSAKNQLVYTVGDKNVNKATFAGEVAWDNSQAYYTADAKYKFGATDVDAMGLKVTGTTTNALKKGDAMTLLSASGLTAGTVTQPTDPGTVTVNYTNTDGIVFGGDAKGEVKAESGSVNYQVTGVTLTSVGLGDWKGNESSMSASGIGDWTVTDSLQVKVTTGDMAKAGLDKLNPGDVKKVLTAVGSVDFSKADISGSKAWKDGGAFDEGTHESGVSVKGSTTGGGVKADDTSKNVLVYQKEKSTVTDITLGAVKYDTSKPVRTFDSAYDLTNAAIGADGFSLSNLESVKANMNAGDTMVVVDATNAIKGTGGATLKDFTKQNAGAAIAFAEKIDSTVLTFSGTHQDTLEQNTDKTQILYKVGDKNVNAVTFDGEVTWNEGEAYYTNDAAKYKFNGATNIDATNLKVTGTATTALKKGASMTLLSAQGMKAGTVTPQSDANKTASKIAVNYSDTASGITFGATATGAVEATDNAVSYKVDTVTLNSVDLAGWTGTTADLTTGDLSGWTGTGVAVNNAAAITVVPTKTQDILTAGNGITFAGVNVEKTVDFDPVTQNGVTLSGTRTNAIKTAKTAVDNDTIRYEIGGNDVKTVSIGAVKWGGDALDGSSGYNYAAASVDSTKFEISNPQEVATGTATTLLKANDTLQAMTEQTKTSSYNNFEVAPGVLMNGSITGKLATSGNAVTYTPSANKATSLTFGDVEWKEKDDGALIDHKTTLANVSFDGATVDTSGINFTNRASLDKDQVMTLVSDFGSEAKITPESTKYTVGAGFEGESETKLEGGHLIFRTKTEAGVSEQTHKTVMSMEADVAMLNVGYEHITNVMTGLGDPANMGEDGTSTAVSIGAGGSRYETGSHVSSHTWNAAVGVGRRRELEKGTLEYGIFGEYGKSSYTLHSDAGQGDGDAHHAGGGLLAKWTNKHDVYTEASIRLGRVSDSASNVLRDGLGNGFGYNVHATYYGAHLGVGKIIRYNGGRSLDVYGKFFYTKRNGVNFTAAGQQYDLDSVASSILRIGARYGTTDKKWNWYGGLAYEYEFDGESTGTVNGAAVRAASIKGSSGRAEIGMRMNATKTNPWQADISLYGYAGKHRGFGGNISVAYMF